MKKSKLQKGMYGYLRQKKKIEIIKTIVLFAIALAVYLLGLWQVGNNRNILTIVAIVGMLPASKSAVSMIMFLRCNPVLAELKEQVDEAASGDRGIVLYDMIFVLMEKQVKTDCIYITDHTVSVYAQHGRMSEADISRELKKFLANSGKGNVAVNVFQEEKKFIGDLKRQKSKSGVQEENASLEHAGQIRDKLMAFSM